MTDASAEDVLIREKGWVAEVKRFLSAENFGHLMSNSRTKCGKMEVNSDLGTLKSPCKYYIKLNDDVLQQQLRQFSGKETKVQ